MSVAVKVEQKLSEASLVAGLAAGAVHNTSTIYSVDHVAVL